MGQLFSSQINPMLIDYSKSLQADGNDGVYTVKEYQTKFNLNKFPGSDNTPKCHMFVKNCSMQCQDLIYDSDPLSMKSSKITIEIGEAIVRCDDLGYIIRTTGRITIFDAFITASFTPTFLNGIGLSDIGSDATVNKIQSEIELHVNGTDHSRLANVLLSIDNPDVASNLLNVVFILQKENIKDFLNEIIRQLASQYGL